MRQVWISRSGEPEVLEVREAPDPHAGADEVRVRVEAAGVNFADIMARMGLYPDAPPVPCVVGYEVSGVIDEVGDGVTDLQVGQRVLALCRFGGYSDVVVVPRLQAAPLPESVELRAAAGVPVNYLTAWLMLVKLGNVQPGDRVLVHAAAGGVGQAALQIARMRGATVIGTASAGKHARLIEAGVSHCIDYHNQDFEQEVMRVTDGEGVDIVLDAVGGKSFRKSYRCLRPMGRLFMFGASTVAQGTSRNLLKAASGLVQMPAFRPIAMMNDNRGVFGINLGHLWDRAEELRAMLDQMVPLLADGTLRPVIDATFPFDQAAAAHRYIQEHRNFGKVLLVP